MKQGDGCTRQVATKGTFCRAGREYTELDRLEGGLYINMLASCGKRILRLQHRTSHLVRKNGDIQPETRRFTCSGTSSVSRLAHAQLGAQRKWKLGILQMMPGFF